MVHHCDCPINEQRGQSTLEFLVTFVMTLTSTMLFVQLALNSLAGNFQHYIVYMASRAYLVFDDSNVVTQSVHFQAEDFIRNQVLNGLSRSGPSLSMDEIRSNLAFNRPGSTLYEYVGVRSKISKKMSLLSLMAGSENVELISESFLGREASRGSCLQRICEYSFDQNLGYECQVRGINNHLTVYDNGC